MDKKSVTIKDILQSYEEEDRKVALLSFEKKIEIIERLREAVLELQKASIVSTRKKRVY